MSSETIRKNLQAAIALKQQVLQDEATISVIRAITDAVINCYRNDGKVFFCGNGGSAADAQHLAAELSGRYYYDRPPLFAEALHVNTSYITAVANDYSFDEIYARSQKRDDNGGLHRADGGTAGGYLRPSLRGSFHGYTSHPGGTHAGGAYGLWGGGAGDISEISII